MNTVRTDLSKRAIYGMTADETKRMLRLAAFTQHNGRVGAVRQLRQNPACGFCGRPSNRVGFLIQGQNGHNICDECVDVCALLVKEQKVKS